MIKRSVIMKQCWYGVSAWLLSMGIGYASDPTALLQTKLSAIHTMTADFTQTITTKNRVISHTTGTMALSRPGRFRWQTKQPSAQIVVADGQQVWIYDVDLEQVAVSQQTKQLGAAGALFLSQTTDAVGQTFQVTYTPKGPLEYFQLRAKSSKANFDKVVLMFQSNILRQIAMDDQLGQHTVVRFNQVHMNQPQSAQLFTFKVPVGVDVVRQ